MPGSNYKKEMSMSIKQIHVDAPWWETYDWMPLGETHFGTHVLMQAFIMQACVRGGGPGLDWSTSGSLADGVEMKWLVEEAKKELGLFELKQNMSDPAYSDCSSFLTNKNTGIHLVLGDDEVTITVCTNSPDVMTTARTFFSDKITKEIRKGRVYVMMQTREGIKFSNIGIGGIPLERGNYSEGVLAGYDRLVHDLESRTPTGRVSILNGPPGGGKTFLVRGILSSTEHAMFIVLQPDMVSRLADPSVIPSLVSLRKDRGDVPMVFVIEDADECLAPRQSHNMGSISAVLNLGDGILGSILDIRIIATTNAKRAELDSAILRPGRLSVHMEIEALEYEKSLEIYKRLTGKDDLAKGSYTLAKIYQLAKDAGWVPAKSAGRKMGFSVEDYL